MVTRFLSAVLLFLLVASTGCSKDELTRADGAKLQQAILSGNPDEAEAEINRICASLPVTTDSPEGLTEINKAISVQCKLAAETVCYNCIYTLPAQSEIRISVISGGTQIEKIIDITRSGDRYIFAGMHN